MCGTDGDPIRSDPTATALMTSATTINLTRECRSGSALRMLPNRTAGATCAINRNESAAGLWVLRTRVAATASAYVQSPRFDTACADHRRMKVRRWKRGRNCPDPEGTRPEPLTRWI